ncbi:uncharacterized protein At5g39865 [Punica granatum]|uniref:Glutaredoxin domain-containing protein n=2 Tax=Punica granatum TaxID=22663 RepID=A0A218XD31_PUNGR|nr:uncharacterized protein At5g39865 [Punica granatum]OWM82599.1 hypothetical protein CDL15_Pgr002174 [Punica granatum]PKI35293.1 hypothetical protein CRG98_044307 [Punica granatum]
MKAMKGRFLKKLNIVSTLKRGLALQHLDPGDKIPTQDDHSPLYGIPDLLNGVKGIKDGQEDDCSSMESVHDDFEDANSSAPESVEFPLSGGEASTDSETCSPREDWTPETGTFLQTEESCPPGGGGAGSVIFYSTSLRGIRKTFEDCSRVRFLLRSFRVRFEERDVSMHREYREELWQVSGGERAVPPKLFVRGRLIGGADEVVGLHERGELRDILHGIPLNPSRGPCVQCGDFWFVICSNCSGSCRIVADTEKRIKCPECNENGLVRCPIC